MINPSETTLVLAIADMEDFDAACIKVNDLFRMPWDGPELSNSLQEIIAS